MTHDKQSDQIRAALDKANVVRLGRAQITRDIYFGKVSVVDVLETKPYVCNTMTIMKLLCAQRGWGRRRALKLLSSIPISESRELRYITKRECQVLVLMLNSTTNNHDH